MTEHEYKPHEGAYLSVGKGVAVLTLCACDAHR